MNPQRSRNAKMSPDSPFSDGEIEDSPITPQPTLPDNSGLDHLMEDTPFTFTIKSKGLQSSRYSAIAESSDPIQHVENEGCQDLPLPRKRTRIDNDTPDTIIIDNDNTLAAEEKEV